MPRGDWDDISSAQRRALRLLCKTAKGVAYAENLRGVRLETLRSLHRYGLITLDGDILTYNSIITITPSGRTSADVEHE